MNTLRQIRRPLLPGEAIPPIPSLYEQIASVKGGIAPVIPQPSVPAPESIEEDGDDENRRERAGRRHDGQSCKMPPVRGPAARARKLACLIRSPVRARHVAADAAIADSAIAMAPLASRINGSSDRGALEMLDH